MIRFLQGLWRTHVTEVRQKAEEESHAYLEANGYGPADRQLAVVMITVMLCLIFMQFFGSAGRLSHWQDVLTFLGLDSWSQGLFDYLHRDSDARFHQRLFWAITRVFAYIIVPALVIRFVLKARIRDYGLRIRGILPSARIYGLMFAAIAPLVVIVSYSKSFQGKYPFYRLGADEPLWPFFVGWELLYALQFVGLEFFYRGFMVHGLKHRLGFASVWVMMVPYMMIHFGKPLPECLGSIIAGFVLGTLSLKSRSVWWGAAIHVAVAWGMDLLSLWHQGKIFS